MAVLFSMLVFIVFYLGEVWKEILEYNIACWGIGPRLLKPLWHNPSNFVFSQPYFNFHIAFQLGILTDRKWKRIRLTSTQKRRKMEKVSRQRKLLNLLSLIWKLQLLLPWAKLVFRQKSRSSRGRCNNGGEIPWHFTSVGNCCSQFCLFCSFANVNSWTVSSTVRKNYK